MEKELSYKKELSIIKNYIGIYPDTPKYKVSACTGISLDVIRELIEEGYLREEEGELKLPRKGNININNEERRNLINRLAFETQETPTINRLKERGQSQGIMGFRNNKNKGISYEDWER